LTKFKQISPLNGRKSGQTLIEYVLLVAFVTLIFGSAFSEIRRSIFRLWICQMYPRIASTSGCLAEDDCWIDLTAASQGVDAKYPVCDQ
jgi:hypothetical protein